MSRASSIITVQPAASARLAKDLERSIEYWRPLLEPYFRLVLRLTGSGHLVLDRFFEDHTTLGDADVTVWGAKPGLSRSGGVAGVNEEERRWASPRSGPPGYPLLVMNERSHGLLPRGSELAYGRNSYRIHTAQTTDGGRSKRLYAAIELSRPRLAPLSPG